MEEVFATRGVSYAYPGGVPALANLSLSLAAGRRTAVLGSNGSGKSTLFALLCGFERPQQGQVLFRGERLSYQRRFLHNLRQQVGIMFQEPDSQLFSASIREDVSFGPLNLGLPVPEVRRRVAEALAVVGLSEQAGRPVHALSHGQKKRVCLAGVLAMHPQILILDEPTAGLDAAMVGDLLELLDQFHRQGRTLIMATQDIDLAYAWADDICILNQGELAFFGQVEEFSARIATLPDTRLGSPWVLEVSETLRRRGMLDGLAAAPRTRKALLEVLSGLPPAEPLAGGRGR